MRLVKGCTYLNVHEGMRQYIEKEKKERKYLHIYLSIPPTTPLSRLPSHYIRYLTCISYTYLPTFIGEFIVCMHMSVRHLSIQDVYIYCLANLRKGKAALLTSSGSNDQDGCTPMIYSKSHQRSFSPEPMDRFPWYMYVAWKTLAYHGLHICSE